VFPENKDASTVQTETSWGSGYPGDAVTKKFLRDNLNPVFGFPSIVRFSWKTAETLMVSSNVKTLPQKLIKYSL
jgi:ribonuclease H2 subunit A